MLCIDSQIGCYKGRRPAARTETFIRACSVLLYTEDLTYEKSDPSDLCIHFHINFATALETITVF